MNKLFRNPHGSIYQPIMAQSITLTGQVQGVGFRPFVYRLAHQYGICGWVKNQLGKVSIFAQGSEQELRLFGHALMEQAPPLARPQIEQVVDCETLALADFQIVSSDSHSDTAINVSVKVPADYFVCDDCLRELNDSENRRYRYPFINCTQCGPRYTIITALPYDRASTTMDDFVMCADCAMEYRNPLDRRFHAEPIACPKCGPQLQFVSKTESAINDTQLVLQQCVRQLRHGAIVAVKGVGGYHLLCDAANEQSVQRLRKHKPRPHKPLAVMFPMHSDDPLKAIRQVAQVSNLEAEQLLDPMRPIVLLRKKSTDAILAEAVAPGLAEVGVFLPYSPLHNLILQDFGGPLVATSANISGEPVITDNGQAQQRLDHVASAFLHHDRPIVRPADDAVYRVIADVPRPLRLGRGVAPLEIRLQKKLKQPLLAVGGQMKNAVALAWQDRMVIAPHIGDLDSPRSLSVFEQVCNDLQQLYQVDAEAIVCDAHPAYASSRWAQRQGIPFTKVFHHHAHASAVAAEYPQENAWLVFTWDGVGFGEDETLWGGETFYGAPGRWQRVASQQTFYLPGGDKAGRDAWRSALALCWQTDRPWPKHLNQCSGDVALLQQAWRRKLNCPQTSAVGRLFDAAAALLDVCNQYSYEGQGPMLLETLADRSENAPNVDMPLTKDADGIWRCDWQLLLDLLLDEEQTPADRAAGFHLSLAMNVLRQVKHICNLHGDFAVGLSGGVFQNRLLTETVFSLLRQEGYRVYLPQHVPANDGGVCFGQVIEALYRANE